MEIEGHVVKVKENPNSVLYFLDSGDEIWASYKKVVNRFPIGSIVKFFYEERDWNGKTNRWAFKAVQKTPASTAPASLQVKAPAPAAHKEAVASRYGEKDLEAFKRKDDLMIRMAVQKNACLMVEAYANALKTLKTAVYSTADEMESGLASYYEFWHDKLEKELKGKETEEETPF